MAKTKILIVDDEAAIVNLVAAYLRPEGYEIFTADNRPGALQAARAFKPDLIVLDVMLPGMDGIEVLTRLRRESNAYVILLTLMRNFAHNETRKIADDFQGQVI